VGWGRRVFEEAGPQAAGKALREFQEVEVSDVGLAVPAGESASSQAKPIQFLIPG